MYIYMYIYIYINDIYYLLCDVVRISEVSQPKLPLIISIHPGSPRPQQRIVFRMIHVKDPLPMGKVWSAWTSSVSSSLCSQRFCCILV